MRERERERTEGDGSGPKLVFHSAILPPIQCLPPSQPRPRDSLTVPNLFILSSFLVCFLFSSPPSQSYGTHIVATGGTPTNFSVLQRPHRFFHGITTSAAACRILYPRRASHSAGVRGRIAIGLVDSER